VTTLLVTIWQTPMKSISDSPVTGTSKHWGVNRPQWLVSDWAAVTYLLPCCDNQLFARTWVMGRNFLLYINEEKQCEVAFSVFCLSFRLRGNLGWVRTAVSSLLLMHNCSTCSLLACCMSVFSGTVGDLQRRSKLPQIIFNSMVQVTPLATHGSF
jgi:hypothetical protein